MKDSDFKFIRKYKADDGTDDTIFEYEISDTVANFFEAEYGKNYQKKMSELLDNFLKGILKENERK